MGGKARDGQGVGSVAEEGSGRKDGPRIDRRTRVWRELSGRDEAPSAEASSEVFDGVSFDYEGEPRCKICGLDAAASPLPHGHLRRCQRSDSGRARGESQESGPRQPPLP